MPTALRRLTTLLLLLAAGGLAGAPAQASNRSLKKTITSQEKQQVKLNEEFFAAIDAYRDNPKGQVQYDNLNDTLAHLQSAEKKYVRAIEKDKASTRSGRKGYERFLDARARITKAFGTFDKALDFYGAEKTSSSLKAVTKGLSQLTSADRKAKSAARLLGARTSQR